MDNHFKHKLQRFRVDWDKEALWEELEPKLPRPKSSFLRYWWVLLPLLFIPACWGELSQWLQTDITIEQSFAEQAPEAMPPNKAIASTKEGPQVSSSQVDVEAAAAPPSHTELSAATTASSFHSQRFIPSYTPVSPTVVQLDDQLLERLGNKINKPLGVLGASAKSDAAKGSNAIKVKTSTNSVANREKMTVAQTLPLKTAMVERDAAAEDPLNALAEVSMTRPLRSDDQGVFVNLLAGAGTLQRKDDFTAVEPTIVEYRRENSERLDPQAAWNIQLEAGYRHHSGLSLSTGLGYSQLHEQFNFDGVVREDTFIQTNERARYFVKPSGDTLFLSGPGVYTQLVNRQVLHNNQVSYYQIPLLLAYRFPKRRWDIELTAGINYLLRSQYRGRISEGFPARIIDDPEIALKRRWGYTMRVGVQYQLLPATYLNLNTQFLQSPAFLRGDIGQQYRSLGIQVGLQYRFRRKI
ncbi:MAG: hypothetical protein AAFP77_06760 [Bacteroidota bacterium]